MEIVESIYFVARTLQIEREVEMFEKYGLQFDEYGNKKTDVTVSVFCLTYNHISFIRKALEGFLKQRTTFPIEVFIFDDASTDGTSDIIIEYARKYPNIFHAVIARTNTYNLEKRPWIVGELLSENLGGKYVAWCEGDDYWIYEYKLQYQYEFMENNKQVSICMHNAIRYNDSNGEVIVQIANMDSGYEDEGEIIFCTHGRIPTSSYFWRNELVDFCADFFIKCPVIDEPLRTWLGYAGSVYYIDKVWSVRNYMHESSWNYLMHTDVEKQHDHNYKYLLYLKQMDNMTKNKFHKQLEYIAVDFCIAELELKKKEKMNLVELQEVVNQMKIKYHHLFDNEFEDAYEISKRNCVENVGYLQALKRDNLKKLYIYGAGVHGKKAIKWFEDNMIEFDGVVVSQKGHSEGEGCAVYAIEEVCSSPQNTYFYLALNRKNRSEVISNLKSRGYENIV